MIYEDIGESYATKADIMLNSRKRQFKSKTAKKRRKKTHPLYNIWNGIMQRCCNEKTIAYKNYGGRGITICDEWKSFFKFADYIEKTIGKRLPGYEIDRKDNNRGYEHGNLRWATSKTNQRNRRNNIIVEIDGESRCLAEWAEILGKSYSKVLSRVTKGTDPAIALKI